jgi:hypothetical protein
MRLDPAPAAAVRGLRFEESEGPDAAREDRKGSDGEVAAAAEALVKKLSAAGEFSGVVLLAKDGKPFFRRACGFADRALSVENRLETKFNLGSINKTFTQLAVAQLAEKGKLSLSPAGALGIAGGSSGVNAVLEIDLDTGYTIVVLSNLDPPSAEKLARTLRQWLGLS